MTDEIDFEVDAEDLDQVATQKEVGEPSLVVDDLSVTYRIVGGHTPPADASGSLLRRAVGRGRRHVGAVHEVKAIRNVSFVARQGEAIGILGINGSGKSTLLRAIAGLVPSSGGSVYSVGAPSLLGVNAVLMSQLSGERNIMVGGLAMGLSPKEVNARFDDIVEFSGIGDSVYLPMRTYSSGMAARLRFAISAAATPDILMIDEALATGDADFRQRSKERMDAIRDHASTVFLVSHSIATVASMCTRAMWLDHGRLVMDGPVGDVTAAYAEFIRAKHRERDAARGEQASGH